MHFAQLRSRTLLASLTAALMGLMTGSLWAQSPTVSMNAPAQHSSPQRNPCGARADWFDESANRTHGLQPTDDGSVVYDSNQRVCWLANANLAGDPFFRAILGVTGVNPDGTMNYVTALSWVAALNNFDGGRGFLGHTNWQLPDNPLEDTTCSSHMNGSFGVSCTGNALANLYSIGLNIAYPDSVVPNFFSFVKPFRNLQPSLYWDADMASDGSGESTFSFNTGTNGANTPKYNYFNVLPMVRRAIGTPPSGTGVLPYTTGPAAGKAVYDTNTGMSWSLDANLAAQNKFGVVGEATINSNYNGSSLVVPLIETDGAMLLEAVNGADGSSGWIAGINASNYAGSNKWELPSLKDLMALYSDMMIKVGDVRLEARGLVSQFVGLQPGFYWACQRDDVPGSGPPIPYPNQFFPCDPSLAPPFVQPATGIPYQYAFNFGSGFEGTDLQTKEFYVMVYFPAPQTNR